MCRLWLLCIAQHPNLPASAIVRFCRMLIQQLFAYLSYVCKTWQCLLTLIMCAVHTKVMQNTVHILFDLLLLKEFVPAYNLLVQ